MEWLSWSLEWMRMVPNSTKPTLLEQWSNTKPKESAKLTKGSKISWTGNTTRYLIFNLENVLVRCREAGSELFEASDGGEDNQSERGGSADPHIHPEDSEKDNRGS